MNWQLKLMAAAILTSCTLTACSGGGGAATNLAFEPTFEDVLTPPPAVDARPAEPVEPTLPDEPDGSSTDTGPGPAGESPTPSEPVSTEPPPPLVRPAAVVALADGGALLNELPDLLFVDTLANSGLQIGYTIDLQQERTDTGFIEEQWDYMQSCLGETGAPPLIVLVDGDVSPLTRNDDVLRFIDGSAVATSSVSLSGTVIQLSEADFDGSFGVPGFHLRQIIGRSLWSAAGLPERDYPTTCARVISPTL